MSSFVNRWWQQWLITKDEATTRVKRVVGSPCNPIPSGVMRPSQPLSLCSLEPRILFSATPIDMAGLADDSAAMVATVELADSPETESLATIATIAEQSSREIIVIDSSVPDLQQFLDDLSESGRDGEVFVLDSDRDGLDQISEILDAKADIDSIHLVSHAENGAVKFGNVWLGESNLAGYSGQIASWQSALTSDADILFYGCDLASNERGRMLVDSISELTGADVAASNDDTGHSSYGGDWELEYTTGTIETSIAFSSQFHQDWQNKLATITVNTFDDIINAGDGLTSLREAIILSNAGGGGDTIDLSTIGAGTFTLTITGTGEDSAATGDLDISKDVTIIGAGAANTIIDGGDIDRLFDIRSGTVTIQDLTVQNGDAGTDAGGGIRVITGATASVVSVDVRSNLGNEGGGIFSTGSLTLTDVTVDGNTATWGGGINLDGGSATLDRVTISNNTSSNNGGGIYIFGVTPSLTNVTISRNTSTSGSGGGLWLNAWSTATNVTIAHNSAFTGGAGIQAQGGGNVTLTNSILHNPLGLNANKALISGGDNIDSDSTAGLGDPLDGIDPMLGGLQDNGGSTFTHALLAGSVAIDPGTVVGAPAVDQRGVARDGTPDIGAYEFVAGGNTAPVAVDDGYNVAQDTTLNVDAVTGVLSNDTDGDGDTLTAYVAQGPDNGVLGLAPLGVVNETNLTNDTSADLQPAFSPDGSKIVFKSDRTGWTEIYTMDVDGSNVVQLTFDGATIGSPTWSDDGLKLSFFSDRSSNYEIYSINADGTGLTQLTSNTFVDKQPHWSPDGSRIVFRSDRDGDNEIYVMDADGTNQTRLTTDAGQDNNPAWSPDGTKIAFTTNRDGNFQVYVMNADGSGQTRVTSSAGNDRAPRFSPDGSRIVFQSDRDGDNELFVIDIDGSNEVQLTSNLVDDGGPSWSPDGTKLAFDTVRDGNSEIYVVDLLFDGTFDYTPNGGYTGVDTFYYVANDGSVDSNTATVAITVDAVNNPPSVSSGGTLAYSEGDGQVVFDAGMTVGDPDGTLQSATVRFISNHTAAEDVLLFSDQNGITGSYDADTGILSLNGSASVDDYQTALRSIQYENTSVNPNTNTRLLTIQVSDGVTSAGTSRMISITPQGPLAVDTSSDVLDGNVTSITALTSDKGADGFISLREAIAAANNTAGVDTIHFAINGTGVHTISIAAALPAVTEAIILDGFTQAGASANTMNIGSDAVMKILLDGSAAPNGTDGLTITGGGSTITGLVINGFRGEGIVISGAGGNTISGNFIGTDVTGTTDVGNTGHGINVSSSNNVIGGNDPSDRNLISGNDAGGVYLDGLSLVGNTRNNTIQGNYIGSTAGGMSALGNGGAGIKIVSKAADNWVGGSGAGEGNLIAASSQFGIVMTHIGTSGNVVQGNRIGVNATGASSFSMSNSGGVGNTGTAGPNLIGGTAVGEGNIIASLSGGHGVEITGGNGILVSGNSIFETAGKGISIELASGGNNEYTPATLTSATTTGASLTVSGSFSEATLAGQNVVVEYFSTPGTVADEGKAFLGFDTVLADGSGLVTINSSIAASVAAGDSITVTVRDSVNNTTIFSNTVQATTGANNPPTVANPIPDQSANEDTPFNFQFAADAFDDLDGDTLTYVATLDDFSPLPGWLTFTAATRTFSGTPTNADVGAITIRVKASDPNLASATDEFVISIANLNDPPTDITLDNSNVNENSDGAIIGNLAVVDPDSGDTHTWNVDDVRFEIVAGQLKLKAGQTLDKETEATVNLTITATDQGGAGLAYNEAFVIAVDDVNDPAVGSVVVTGLAQEDQTLVADASGISDEEGLGPFSYQWLRNGVVISAATGGTYTLGDDDVGNTIRVRVSFTDGQGNAEGPLLSGATAIVSNVNDAPTLDTSGNLALGTIQQDVPSSLNNGNSIVDILNSGGGNPISDPDGPLSGIAIISIDDANGTWQFSTDGGTTWTSMDPDDAGIMQVDNSRALLLEADAGQQNRIRFQPTAGYNGSAGEIEFRAWDGTELPIVGNGGYIDISTVGSGGETAFSTAVEKATLWVNAPPTISDVNDQAIMVNRSTSSLGINVNDDEDGGSPLLVSATSSNTALVPMANISITGSGTNREVTLSPVANETGITTITVTVTDNDGGKTQTSFDVFVAPHTVTVSTFDDVVDADDLSSISHLLYNPGADGAISLREAILASNNTVNGSGPDLIVLPAGIFSLNGNEIAIDDDVVITGATANTTQIDGNGLSGVFHIGSASTATITDVTIRGADDSGGAIRVDDAATLNLQDVTLRDNVGESGGAMHIDGTIDLNRVTLTNNMAQDGGAIYLHDADGASLTNVTISGNAATKNGGAIWSSSSITITNSTIAFNEAGNQGAGLFGSNVASVFTLLNTILTENQLADATPENVSAGTTVSSLGYNIDSDGTAGIANVGDQSGTTTAPLDVGLIALAFNGGTTQTHSLRATSIAIDAGTATGAPNVDQRGGTRPLDGNADTVAAVDIGAFETGNVPAGGTPSITGIATEDSTLTADTTAISDPDGLGTFTFLWLRDGVAITGATANTYTLGDIDVGKWISVQVSYVDGGGTPEGPLASLPRGPIVNVNDLPVGVVILSGTVTEGQVLTATNAFSDDDGIGVVSYQWQRDGVDIAGATTASYTLGNSDVAAVMTVVASYTDAHGTSESVSSLPTAPVAERPIIPPPPPPLPPPVDEGDDEEAEVPPPPPEEPELEDKPEEPPAKESEPDSPTDQVATESGAQPREGLVAVLPTVEDDAAWLAEATSDDSGAGGEKSEAEKSNEKRADDSDNNGVRSRLESIYQVSPFDTQWHSLDSFRDDLIGEKRIETLVVGAAVGVSVAVSVGQAVWALRAGYMASTLMTTMPIWRTIDPLPVLEYLEGDPDRPTDTESLQSIIEDGQSKHRISPQE